MSDPGAPLVPLPAIVADIGGTNGRFAIVDRDRKLGPTLLVRTADAPTLAGAIRHHVAPQSAEPPRSAVLAMAGIVQDEKVALTNGPWVAEPLRLIAEEGLAEVAIVNDFEALSLSLPDLGPADLDSLGGGPGNGGTRVVIGPGTGLGAAGLVRTSTGWVGAGGEGGHIDFGPRTPRDLAIWPHLARVNGRISAEEVVSGRGMVNLYRAIAKADGRTMGLAEPAAITEAGLSGDDPVAVETLELFATYLGRYAGDLALIFMARGGVFLGGGIAPRIASIIKRGGFRAAFNDKAPHDELMAGLPVSLITHAAPALVGLAAFVRSPASYTIGLEGRHWR